MTAAPTAFWALRLACQQDQISILEEAFTDEAQALSTLEATQSEPMTLEILYNHEPDPASVRTRLALLESVTGQAFTQIPFTIASLGSLDWIKEVAQEFPPLGIGRWTIFGTAFRDQVSDKTHGLQIDSTSAFGNGEHPTTRGCLLMLDLLLRRFPRLNNATMLDVGCGSGILAMAFVKATQGRALGIDMDAESIAIAHETIRANGLQDRLEVERGLGYSNPSVAAMAPFDLVMANIFADPLCALAKDMKRHLKPGGLAILSGLLAHQAKAVAKAHEQQGIKVIKRMRLGAWSVLALRKPISAS